jgi:ribosomal protein S18 acetylase RimI-like enzyme
MSGVRVAEPSDLARVVRTATLAFADDPVLRWFFPSEAEYAASAPAAFEHVGGDSIALGCAYVTPDVVAAGLYVPPGRPEVPRDEPEEPADIPADLAQRFAAFGRLKDEHTPAEPHWYLGVLATHPDWQRQGCGAAIIAPVAERCRTEGLPLYLETETVANVAYYRHLGFEVRSEWDVPLDGPHMWGMILTP